ncbi:MAG: hypothetical protein HW378_722 [Anaerolineales bacterium]|nr:hypothetical protein [Anaerolineales bacterium]MBM2850422.1 hypothetical protein [Anaerolineales bacterium]
MKQKDLTGFPKPVRSASHSRLELWQLTLPKIKNGIAVY